jgi:transcriptional regulator with XRE-family HTH domain
MQDLILVENISEILKQKRNEAGLSLEELAERTGFDSKYIELIETGRLSTIPHSNSFVTIAEALNIEKDEMYITSYSELYELFEKNNIQMCGILLSARIKELIIRLVTNLSLESIYESSESPFHLDRLITMNLLLKEFRIEEMNREKKIT